MENIEAFFKYTLIILLSINSNALLTLIIQTGANFYKKGTAWYVELITFLVPYTVTFSGKSEILRHYANRKDYQQILFRHIHRRRFFAIYYEHITRSVLRFDW